MRQRNVPLCDQRGFTLVEVMVAALILMVGVLGTFTLLDGATKTQRENNARIAATNLAREIVERARSVDYDVLNLTQMEGQIRPRVVTGTVPASTEWKVERRGVVYTVGLTVCMFDDPKDGLTADVATKFTPNLCSPRPAAVNTTTDGNPDDFRRVEVTLSYRRGRADRQLSQTALIVNPSGGLGPRLTLDGPLEYEDAIGTKVTFTGKSRPASTLRWFSDSGTQETVVATNGVDWSFDVPLGKVGDPGFTVDGPYLVSAQAFDGRGVPGDVAFRPVHVNRRLPGLVQNFLVGRNNRHGGVVDLRWTALRDRDIQLYRVTRVSNSVRTVICADRLITECTDTTPPGAASGEVRYEIVALDRADPSNTATPLREGAVRSEPVGNAGNRPVEPSLSVSTNADGQPRLTWTQPSGSENPIIFYRIYREDSAGLFRRYDRTLTTDPTYTDQSSGTAPIVRYWITSVDSKMNESRDSNIVEWVR